MGKNSRTSFEKEMLVHLDALYNTALRLTRSEAGAGDLVQDTYVKALRFWESYTPGTNSKAWIFKVMMNLFYTECGRKGLEKERIEQRAFDPNETAESIDLDLPEMKDIDSIILDAIQDDALSEAIGALPPDFRAVIVMSDIEEMTYREIAETLGVPDGTVMSRLYRARKILQGRLRSMAVDRGIVVESKREQTHI